jgi:hypothetical protein
MVEMKKIEAEVAKIVAERDLINEKSVTERVTQTVKLAGVDYDDQMVKMQRAKLVNDMESGAVDRHHDAVKTGMDFALKAHQGEQGVRAEHDKLTLGASMEMEKLDRAEKAGYNEKGMQSNNEE